MTNDQLSNKDKQILWSIGEFLKGESSNDFCFAWIASLYAKRFGEAFHQSALKRLVKLELLQPSDVVRGGSRRYYTVLDRLAVDAVRSSF